jgi:hypothetical protein
MLKVTVIIGMLLAAVVPAQATVVMYTFTGTDLAGIPTLAGTFFLDDSTLVVSTFVPNPPLGPLLEATLGPSPLDTITGTFNGIAFTGTARLIILNLPLFNDTPFGQWIVRSDITSADASLVHLNMLINASTGTVPISLTPPAPCCNHSCDICDHSYAIVFADGTFASGVLSLPVPELPTGLLVALAGTLLAFMMRSVGKRRGLNLPDAGLSAEALSRHSVASRIHHDIASAHRLRGGA